MPNQEPLSKEQLDFLKEIMNIGVGNAVTALSQILQRPVEVRIPAVYALPPRKIPSLIGDAERPVVCVKMGMVGDVTGEIFFIVREEEKAVLAHLAEKALLGKARKGTVDISVLEEIGNIMAGVYLTAVHDFCKLNIYHSVPATATDMFQSILDELVVNMGGESESFIVIENEFAIVIESEIASIGKQIKAFLLMIPSVASVKTLVESVKQARPE